MLVAYRWRPYFLRLRRIRSFHQLPRPSFYNRAVRFSKRLVSILETRTLTVLPSFLWPCFRYSGSLEYLFSSSCFVEQIRESSTDSTRWTVIGEKIKRWTYRRLSPLSFGHIRIMKTTCAAKETERTISWDSYFSADSVGIQSRSFSFLKLGG